MPTTPQHPAPAPKTPRSGPSGLLGWWIAHRSGRTMVLTWIVSRLLMLGILAVFEDFIVGDVDYYHGKIAGLFTVGLPATLNEYPTPVVWILTLPYGLALGHKTAYLVIFMAFMLALDAAFTYAVWRAGGRRHDTAVDFWLAFVFLVGPLSYVRFDIIPAVLAGGALLAARSKPWVAGALTGLGAAIKLWPALLFPALLAAKGPQRKPLSIGFVVVGFGLALLSLVFGGMSRLFSPLTWQSGRGLQIESVWASPLMLARMIRPDAWVVDISRYQAYEIFGSGVGLWQMVSNVATIVGLVLIVLLWFRAFRVPGEGVTPVAVALVVLATVVIVIITNKTLSPQYLLWVGGPVAALLLLRDEPSAAPLRRWIVRTGIAALVLAGLTQLVYPLLYDGYLGFTDHAGMVLATLVTVLRNVFLLAFTVVTVWLAWRATSSSPATPSPAAGAGR